MKQYKQGVLENLIYAIIWLLVFLMPLLEIRQQGVLEWMQVKHYWLRLLPYFLLFLINNYFLLPCFLLRKKGWSYLLLVLVLMTVLFTVWPVVFGRGPVHRGLPEQPERHILPQHSFPPPSSRGEGPLLRMPVMMRPMLNDWLVALLIAGCNIAICFLFKSLRDDRQIKDLERHTLQAELDYLKAQINPHFFMNTLNNIHALVDIDTEKAKQTVIELSKIMRYVLYDANQGRVPVSKEVQFLHNYVALMRIRFTNEVDIHTEYPSLVPDTKIPPLLLMALMENAFKHGISYRRKSFIYSVLSIDSGRLMYMVENSAFPNTSHPKGVGLENLRKRLLLIYGANYSLDIMQEAGNYKITLNIPIES